MKILSFLLRQSRGVFFFSLLAGALSGVGGAALLGLVNAAINEENRNTLLLGGAFAGLCVLVALTRVVSHVLLVRLGEDAVMRIRLQLIHRVMATPLAKIEQVGKHRLLAALTEDTLSIANALVLLPSVGINLLVIVSSLAYLGWLSPQVMGSFMVVLLLAAGTYAIPIKYAMANYRKAREEQDGLFSEFRSLTEGTKELQLHAPRQRAFVGLLERITRSLRNLYVSGATIAGTGHAWGQLLVFVAVGALIFVLPVFQSMSRETLTGYTLVVFYIMSPFQYVLQTVPLLGRGGVAVDRVERLGLSLADSDREAEMPRAPDWSRLSLSGVIYGYRSETEDRDFVVGPIDLELAPGEVIFLIGGNGSGKTTLAKILTGLYAPQMGEIALDGRPVTDEDREDYRQLFSTVFSDFHLFDTLLGLEHPDLDRQALAYLKRLELERKVTITDGSFSTVDLSQGQRKRLALLSAFLEDRSIYLFDEWAADQDPEFKEIFYRQILGELKARGKTVLVISHDDRYFDVADRILKLEEGRLLAPEPAASAVS